MTSEEPKTITTQISPAIEKQLEQIAAETGRSKADLIREAILILIGMYKNART